MDALRVTGLLLSRCPFANAAIQPATAVLHLRQCTGQTSRMDRVTQNVNGDPPETVNVVGFFTNVFSNAEPALQFLTLPLIHMLKSIAGLFIMTRSRALIFL